MPLSFHKPRSKTLVSRVPSGALLAVLYTLFVSRQQGRASGQKGSARSSGTRFLHRVSVAPCAEPLLMLDTSTNNDVSRSAHSRPIQTSQHILSHVKQPAISRGCSTTYYITVHGLDAGPTQGDLSVLFQANIPQLPHSRTTTVRRSCEARIPCPLLFGSFIIVVYRHFGSQSKRGISLDNVQLIPCARRSFCVTVSFPARLWMRA